MGQGVTAVYSSTAVLQSTTSLSGFPPFLRLPPIRYFIRNPSILKAACGPWAALREDASNPGVLYNSSGNLPTELVRSKRLGMTPGGNPKVKWQSCKHLS